MAKKKRAGAGKEKGSKFERVMCKRLSSWWTGGENDQVFWRNSGFLVRGPRGCKEHQYGDVHAISAPGQDLVRLVNIELKFYRDLRILDVIDKPGKGHVTLLDHWAQCRGDAEASEREPLLIAKRNFAEPFVMCLSDLARKLVEDGDRLEFYEGENYVSLFALATLTENNTAGDFMAAFEKMRRQREVR